MTGAGATRDVVDAKIVWSAIAEPGDRVAAGLREALGTVEALAWVRRAARDPHGAAWDLALDPGTAAKVMGFVERWAPRLGAAEPDALRERAARVRARILTSADPEWPRAFARLGPYEPLVLWVRGPASVDEAFGRSIAIVGSRASTTYGDHVASEMASAAADRGVWVVSGGAYGIDAAAHRGALAAGGRTIGVLAGGVDQLYPRGNTELLERILEDGAIMSEQPPGFAPHRARFLSRNRLIATARATVVVEAAARSGALSTARHAVRLARPVGAVPGPVTSAASRGCHVLVREGEAVLVTTGDEALELALPAGDVVTDGDPGVDQGGEEFATQAERQAYGALSSRGASTDRVAVAAGLTAREAMGALGGLHARGLVERVDGRWRRPPKPRKEPDKADITPQTMGD